MTHKHQWKRTMYGRKKCVKCGATKAKGRLKGFTTDKATEKMIPVYQLHIRR